ncbi:HEAT repeat domain-containing protein [Halobaculum sp. MBLA0143]|uniref:HEAT repeat domain-containing protein n=1 Tax=Halobaculum sp. MBLA0143 TaxID=3079933 RepID=UPI00352630D3
MSEDDDTSASDAGGEGGEDAVELSREEFEDRLGTVADAVADAETEAALDDAEAELDDVADRLSAADLPEPDDDDESLDDQLVTVREDLTAARGPYAEDATDEIDDIAGTLRDTRWTDDGEAELADAQTTFVETVGDALGTSVDAATSGDAETLADGLETVAAAVLDAELDPDDDAETVQTLLSATETLADGVDAAEEWDDLEVREQLAAQGYYDVLGHYKDFPPEWAALKEWEQRGNVEMVLLALDSLGSEFMERHCLEAITRMNDQGAFEEMHSRAQRRGEPAIEALGKMAADDAVETLVDYVDEDSNPQLQKVTFKALGEIGHTDAVRPLADQLVADNEEVRPFAARALGMIGDTRAVAPLQETLRTDEVDTVRAAAAWALRQIGTRAALEAASEATDDDAYIVESEAERAADALDSDEDAVPA